MSDGDLKLAAAKPPRHVPWRSKKNKTLVGVLNPCYGASHVIYGLDTPRYYHEQLATLPLSRLDRSGTFLGFTPFVVDSGVPLVHTWNAIPVNKNFVVSFELEIPRYLGAWKDWQVKFGLQRLASSRCKAILPLSDFARHWAVKRFEHFGFNNLIDKTQVFRGAVQDPLDSDLPARPSMDLSAIPFRAILIGTHLFHKGATFAIEAVERLRASGRDVELTLVGDFELSSHAYREAIPSATVWRNRVKACDWITLLAPMPRLEVLAELRRHHVCLFPSLDESLGWVPIEAQLCEVPVLANHICALPELIDHRSTGWLVDLPVTADGRWEGMSPNVVEREALLAKAGDAIISGIFDFVESVFADPNELVRWGRAGRAKMLRLYGMEQASSRLNSIYDDALSSYQRSLGIFR